MIFRRSKDFVVNDFKKFMVDNDLKISAYEKDSTEIFIAYAKFRFPNLLESLSLEE